MRRRNRSVLLWLSDAELYELKAKAERAGLSQQAFLRDLILGCEIHEALPVDFPPLIREMNRIGSNIGQMLRIMNVNHMIDVPRLRKALDEWEELQTEMWDIFKPIQS